MGYTAQESDNAAASGAVWETLQGGISQCPAQSHLYRRIQRVYASTTATATGTTMRARACTAGRWGEETVAVVAPPSAQIVSVHVR